MLPSINDKAYSAVVDKIVNTPTYKTRRATYALNKKKLTKNLKKDTAINSFETTVNNFDENVNIKCSSGFFLEVIKPGFIELEQQSNDLSSPLIIDNVTIHCTNENSSRDNYDLHINTTYMYSLSDHTGVLGTVRIHCHVTTKLVQLQGSRLVHGMKAPVWFFNKVLKNTLEKEAIKKKASIDNTNSKIMNIENPAQKSCETCNKKIAETDKTYECCSCKSKHHKKCTPDRSNRSRTQPLEWKCSLCLSLQSNLRKRPITEVTISDDENIPPPKAIALSCPVSKSCPTTSVSLLSSTSVSTAIAKSCATTSVSLLSSTSVSTAMAPSNPDNSSAYIYLNQPTDPPSREVCVSQPMLPITRYIPDLNISAPPFVPASSPPTSVLTASLSSSSITSTLSPSTTRAPPNSASTVTTTATVSLPVSTATVSSGPLNIRSKNKQKKTLALSPEDFEKENLKVERDACRLKLAIQDAEMKELKDKIKILSTRCDLFEKQRNDQAFKNISLPDTSMHAPPTTRSPPSSSSPPQATPAPSPQATPVYSEATINQMIQLEVLKALRGNPDLKTNDCSDKLDDLDRKLKKLASVQDELLESVSRLAQTKPQPQTVPNIFTFPPPPLPTNRMDPSSSKIFSNGSPNQANSAVYSKPSNDLPSQLNREPKVSNQKTSASTQQSAWSPSSTARTRKCALPIPVCQDFCSRHGCPSRPASDTSPQSMGPSKNLKEERIRQSKKKERKQYQTRIFVNKATHDSVPQPCDQLEVDLDAYLSTSKIFENKNLSNTQLLKINYTSSTESQHNVGPFGFVHGIVVDLVDAVATMPTTSLASSQFSDSIISLDDSIITDSFGDPRTESSESLPSLN